MMILVPAGNGWMCESDPGEPGLGVKRWSINDTEARLVSELFRGLTVLEIGTGLGVSTRAIAKKANWVHTVDIDPWVAENVVLPPNVFFYRDIKDVPEGLDATFIDGYHNRKQCIKDIRDARRIVKPGGLIIFHDALMKPIHQAIIDSKIECTLIHTVCGLAVGWIE